MNIKGKLFSLKNDICTSDAAAIGFKTIEFLMYAMTAVCVMMMFSQVCYADTDIFTAGAEIGKSLYTSIVGMSTVLAGVMIAIAACMYFFATNERTVASAKSWIIRIIAAWFVINGVGLLLSTVKNLMGNYAGTTLDGI